MSQWECENRDRQATDPNRHLRLEDWPLLSCIDGSLLLTHEEFMARLMDQDAEEGTL
jgi:hypothetical protein